MNRRPPQASRSLRALGSLTLPRSRPHRFVSRIFVVPTQPGLLLSSSGVSVLPSVTHPWILEPAGRVGWAPPGTGPSGSLAPGASWNWPLWIAGPWLSVAVHSMVLVFRS